MKKRGTGFGRLLLKKLRKRPSRSRAQSKVLSARKGKRAKPAEFFRPLSFIRKVRVTSPASPSHSLPVPIQQTLAPSIVSSAPVAQEAAPANDMESDSAPRFLRNGEILRPNESLRASIEGFLLDQRSEHTRRSYGKDLKRFVQYLLHRRMEKGEEKIDRSLIIAYKDFLLSESLEHTTIDRHLATLRSFFRWLVDDGRIEKSPVDGVRFLNPKRLSRTIGFSDEEVRKILSVPNLHTRTGSQHYAILAILFYCGLRRSELCSLRTSNVGMERGQPVFRIRGKGNSERLIVIVPTVWKALNHYFTITARDRSRDQYLFSPIRNNRTGTLEKPLDTSMIFYLVTRYAKEAGVANRVSPHSCRATAISNARDHQVADRAIQEFAGWASPDMITRYDKRKTAVEDSAARAIRYGSEASENLPHPIDKNQQD